VLNIGTGINSDLNLVMFGEAGEISPAPTDILRFYA